MKTDANEQKPAERQEKLRIFLEKVRSRPKRELVMVKMPGGGWAVVKRYLPFQNKP